MLEKVLRAGGARCRGEPGAGAGVRPLCQATGWRGGKGQGRAEDHAWPLPIGGKWDGGVVMRRPAQDRDLGHVHEPEETPVR